MTIVLGVIYWQEPLECETDNTSMKNDQCVLQYKQRKTSYFTYITKTRTENKKVNPRTFFPDRNFYLKWKGLPVP